MVEYKISKSGNMTFKTSNDKRFRQVYTYNNKPSKGFKQVIRGNPNIDLPPNFNFVYDAYKNRFLAKSKLYDGRKKTQALKPSVAIRYGIDNGRLIDRSTSIERWNDRATQFIRGNKNRSFTLNLKSATSIGVSRSFNFTNIHHFETWYDKIVNEEIVATSSETVKYLEVDNAVDVFTNSVIGFDWTNGGCSACHSQRTIEGAYATFEITNPKSRRNNCGLYWKTRRRSIKIFSTCLYDRR